MSIQNALWLIQNLRPIFKFLLRSSPKNKALTLQMADVKTIKCCSCFTHVKITPENSCWHCFSWIHLKLLANISPFDLRVPPSPTFCCVDQHKDWFTILICSILQIILPSCLSRYKQLNQITELQIAQLLNSFKIFLKGVVLFKYSYKWNVFKYCKQVFQQFLVETTEGKKRYD